MSSAEKTLHANPGKHISHEGLRVLLREEGASRISGALPGAVDRSAPAVLAGRRRPRLSRA
ncbi:hypothetical protein AB0J63_46455 [Streptosporangium canum]|uniref:hypothetical protein n=1 Tax=Streptosporangium canum TaxID=324952 RepID=UPI003415E3FB